MGEEEEGRARARNKQPLKGTSESSLPSAFCSKGRQASRQASIRSFSSYHLLISSFHDTMACPMRFLLVLLSVVVALFVVGKTSSVREDPAAAAAAFSPEKQKPRKKASKSRAMLSFGWEAFSGLYLWRIYKQHNHQKAL